MLCLLMVHFRMHVFSRWNNWLCDCLFKTGIIILKVSQIIILHLSCPLAHSGVYCPIALGWSNKYHLGQLLKITSLAHSLRPVLLLHQSWLAFHTVLMCSSFSFPYLDSENIVNKVTIGMFHFVPAAPLSFSHPLWSLTICICSF